MLYSPHTNSPIDLSPKATNYTLVTSSPTKEGLLKQVQSYFYSPNIFFQGDEIHNSTGALKNFRVKQKAKRWRLERINQN